MSVTINFVKTINRIHIMETIMEKKEIKVRRRAFIPTPKILKQIEDWIAVGVNIGTIAQKLGFTAGAFLLHRDKYPEIDVAIQEGKTRDVEVMESILRFMVMDENSRSRLPALKYYMSVKHNWQENSTVNVITTKKVDKLEFVPFKTNDKEES